jgi:cytochrome c peroxidase
VVRTGPGATILAACAAAVLPACSPAHREVRAAPPEPVRSSWRWELPAGFPPPRVPPDNPISVEKVELGRRLFYDTRLSGNGSYACASCHRQELAFTDGRARALGSTDELHARSAMSLANVAYNASLTWADPRIDSLEAQARMPMLNEHPVELGLRGREEEVLGRLRDDARYTALFAEAFPEDEPSIRMENVTKALASFERTLISGDSPYHRLVYLGETDALSESARRGMRLFFSDRLRCSQCHSGFNFSGPVAFEGSGEVEPTFHNTGLYDLDGKGAYPAGNEGLFRVTGRSADMGRFRAPTLHNVAVTAPYMHDGSVATLEEVIAIYAEGGRVVTSGPVAGDGRVNPRKSARIPGFDITRAEVADLVAFLCSLTDESFLTDPRYASPFPADPTPARATGGPTTPAGLSASGRTTPRSIATTARAGRDP